MISVDVAGMRSATSSTARNVRRRRSGGRAGQRAGEPILASWLGANDRDGNSDATLAPFDDSVPRSGRKTSYTRRILADSIIVISGFPGPRCSDSEKEQMK